MGVALEILKGVHPVVEGSSHFLTNPIAELVVLGADHWPVVHLPQDLEDEAG